MSTTPFLTGDKSDDLISLEDAALLLPSTKKKTIAPRTIHDWSRKGCRGVRLRTIRSGGQCICTTRRWLREFLEALALTDNTRAITYHRSNGSDKILNNAGI